MYENGLAGAGDLGRRVAARRRHLGLSREQVAAQSGISLPYLTYLETHPANVTLSCLIRLAKVLESTPAALLGAGPAAVPHASAGQRAISIV
jgi:transcriptional regulator with XRE-family HTH domain